ncbi:hypothetical protein [Micromonospora sp. S-DT3-3-22]|uniref:hypothetical protein n=1 Tax=Micromonospora sp. S-DT3-3-22 TaxID=2755359 RepID=UPI00188FA643|nr:hypothetical protein [Micromonospora sp. S-DT3-3-22]
MTTPIENLIRATLSDLAEEAPTVHDHLNRAERRARSRRRATITMSAVGVLAAVLIGTPLAMAASGGGDAPPAVPATTPSGPPAAPVPAAVTDPPVDQDARTGRGAPAPARTAIPAPPGKPASTAVPATSTPAPPAIPASPATTAVPASPVPALTAQPVDGPRTGPVTAPAPARTAPPVDRAPATGRTAAPVPAPGR